MKCVRTGDFYDMLTKCHDINLRYNSWPSECTISFPNSNLPDKSVRVDAHVYALEKPKSVGMFQPQPKRQMVYSGCITEKEGAVIKFVPMLVVVMPTSDDSDVTLFPELCECHGNKCRIYDTDSGYLCTSCNGDPIPEDWPRYRKLNKESLMKIQDHVTKVYSLEEELVVDLKQDATYINNLKIRRDVLYMEITRLEKEKSDIDKELLLCGIVDPPLIDL
jgi:hypothetical protein